MADSELYVHHCVPRRRGGKRGLIKRDWPHQKGRWDRLKTVLKLKLVKDSEVAKVLLNMLVNVLLLGPVVSTSHQYSEPQGTSLCAMAITYICTTCGAFTQFRFNTS